MANLGWLSQGTSRAQAGRELHKDYTTSDSYQALFKGALVNAAGDTGIVDTLVTGLPVSQYHDKSYVLALQKRMQGMEYIVLAIKLM